MKKKEMKTKVMAVAMSATMAASICPAVPAMAVTKDQVWVLFLFYIPETSQRLHSSLL